MAATGSSRRMQAAQHGAFWAPSDAPDADAIAPRRLGFLLCHAGMSCCRTTLMMRAPSAAAASGCSWHTVRASTGGSRPAHGLPRLPGPEGTGLGRQCLPAGAVADRRRDGPPAPPPHHTVQVSRCLPSAAACWSCCTRAATCRPSCRCRAAARQAGQQGCGVCWLGRPRAPRAQARRKQHCKEWRLYLKGTLARHRARGLPLPCGPRLCMV